MRLKVALVRTQVLWDVTLCGWTSSSFILSVNQSTKPDDEGTSVFSYVELHMPNNTAPHSRILEPSVRMEFPLSPLFLLSVCEIIISQLQCNEQSSLCITNVCVCVCVCVEAPHLLSL
jgi:hypothetical protein